jgi:hypothetical protein
MSERYEMHTEFLSGKMRRKDHMKDLGINGRITLRFILKKWGGMVWTGLIKVKLRTSGSIF